MEKYARKLPKDIVSIKLNNLKKIINSTIVENQIIASKSITDDETDALNIAYYSLKDAFSKIQRYKYGVVLSIDYKPKTIEISYNDYTTIYDYTTNNVYYWAPLQTAFYTTSSSTYSTCYY